MKGKTGMRAFSMLLAVLLLGLVVHVAYADVVIDPGEKPAASDSRTLVKELSIRTDESGPTGGITVVDITGGSEQLQGIPIPAPWRNIKPERFELTEGDWAFIKDAAIDLSEDEKNRFVTEIKMVFAGESTLSQKEQDDLLRRLGCYLIEATEGAKISPTWEIDPKPGHRDISMAAGRNMRYVSLSHNNTLGDYARWADDNRGEPSELGPFQNRHSWIFDDLPVPYCDNYGPDSAEIYLNRAKSDFESYNGNLAYIDIGKGLHYVSDLGCPFHTSGAQGQAHHVFYEDWVQGNWNLFESATNSNVYYIITNPSEDLKTFAHWTNQYLGPICHIIISDPLNWGTNTTLIGYTQTLVAETEKMAMGALTYASKFESPDTIGSNTVPIWDYQTSYAFIDDVACTDSMRVSICVSHAYIGDLEVWLGWKDDSEVVYREAKIWDRQGGSEDHLNINIYIDGWYDVHDWRLRVGDSAGGDEGAITEFYVLVG